MATVLTICIGLNVLLGNICAKQLTAFAASPLTSNAVHLMTPTNSMACLIEGKKLHPPSLNETPSTDCSTGQCVKNAVKDTTALAGTQELPTFAVSHGEGESLLQTLLASNPPRPFVFHSPPLSFLRTIVLRV